MSCPASPTLMEIAGGNSCPSQFSSVVASPTSVDLWIADATAAGGGFRLTLNSGTAVTAGGHSYRFNSGDGLFGTGTSGGVSTAIVGSVALSVDGQASQITFNFAGCGEGGMPPASVAARVTSMRGGTSQTQMRTYGVTMPGGGVTYQLTNGQAPAGCDAGVDLMGLTF